MKCMMPQKQEECGKAMNGDTQATAQSIFSASAKGSAHTDIVRRFDGEALHKDCL